MTHEPGHDETIFEKARREEREERRRKEKAKPNGHAFDSRYHEGEERAPPLVGLVAATLKGKQKPREFLDSANVFPIRNVALLSGDGAVGKSLLALQLGIACTTGTEWLGLTIAQGPVVYFNAEDDSDEITIRVNEICDAEGIELADAHGLHIFPMAGEDETMLAVEEHGKLKATIVYHRLRSTIEDISPVLVVLDNVADIFGGNENNRTQVKQFISLLRRLCIRFDTTIMMLGHPSVSGRTSGTGESGSTAWNNSVRVRAYLQRAKEDDEGNDRILEVMKANYSKAQMRFQVKWANGRFITTEAKSAFSRIAVDDVDKVRAKFANQFYRVSSQASNWGGFAVADVLGWDAGKGVKSKYLSPEQERNRADISAYLSQWLTNKVLYVISVPDAYRKPVDVFSVKPDETLV